jgi:hypothetical protein
MANVDAPKGLIPVKHLDGSPWNGQTTMYLMTGATGACYIGDAVKSGGTAGAAGTFVNGVNCEGMQTVVPDTAGSAATVGVVVGFSPKLSDLSMKYRENSTDRIAYVVDAPDVIFEIQEDSVSSTLAATDVGANADLIAGSGSTTTGVSGHELDSDTATSGAAGLRILRLVSRPDNVIGTNAKWEVVINEHAYKTTSGV